MIYPCKSDEGRCMHSSGILACRLQQRRQKCSRVLAGGLDPYSSFCVDFWLHNRSFESCLSFFVSVYSKLGVYRALAVHGGSHVSTVPLPTHPYPILVHRLHMWAENLIKICKLKKSVCSFFCLVSLSQTL